MVSCKQIKQVRGETHNSSSLPILVLSLNCLSWLLALSGGLRLDAESNVEEEV